MCTKSKNKHPPLFPDLKWCLIGELRSHHRQAEAQGALLRLFEPHNSPVLYFDTAAQWTLAGRVSFLLRQGWQAASHRRETPALGFSPTVSFSHLSLQCLTRRNAPWHALILQTARRPGVLLPEGFFLWSRTSFPVLKKSDLASSLRLPNTWWQSLPRLSRTQERHKTMMDSVTAPEHCELLGPSSHTLITPLSLGLASNWAAAQTHRPQIPGPAALPTFCLKLMSFLILTDVRKIYPERSDFTACVFWCVCSFSALGSQATAPSPNPRSPVLKGYKL